jgi:general secretion pathway protein D
MAMSGLGARGITRLSLILILVGSLWGCMAAGVSVQHGEELGAAGRWEEAAQFFMEAAKQEPQNIEVRIGLAISLQEASQQVAQQAERLLNDNRLDEAAAAYRRALSYNSENTAAQAGLERIAVQRQVGDRLTFAQARIDQREWRAAQSEVAAALRLDPEHPRAKAMQQQITLQLKAEGPPPSAESDEELAAKQMFSTQPVTLRFRDTDIKEVLEVFSRTAGVNIFTDESLPAKRITTYFKDLPLREAFNLILVSNRLFAKRVAPNTVIVVPDNPGKRQQYDSLSVQTFYLSDADAKVAVNLLRTILNTRQVFVNEKLNALVVRDTPEKIELARKVLSANDRGVGEVEIDLEVLEVDRERLENLGIDLQPRTYSVLLAFPQTIPIQSFWTAIRSLSTLSITNPSLILNLVKSDSSTKILANPTVRVLDRQKARLLIGQRRPFQISSFVSVPAVAGSAATLPTGAVSTTQTNVEYRDIGLKLTLTPIVHLTGEVTVEMNFEISAVGAPIAGVSGGDLLPPVNTRNLDTFIKVKNGETRLLGGLLQTTDTVNNSRVPFLSDIPGLGRLFVSPNTDQSRTDVLISITPRIVKILERPVPDIESFPSGTAESFGPPAPIPVITPPAPAPTPPAPRPVVPQPSPPPGPGTSPTPGTPLSPGAPQGVGGPQGSPQ